MAYPTEFGENCISATVIANSISPQGIPMITFELTFHRYLLPEVNTHRMLRSTSKNTASSRAIPVQTILDLIRQAPAMPTHWGANNPGMQSRQELDQTRREAAIATWLAAMESALSFARVASDKVGINGHKQWVNRLTEPFATSKTVMSGTNWANLWWLRDHVDTQPEFRELVRVMQAALAKTTPVLLYPGQWHLPYIDFVDGKYYSNGVELDLETAKRVSTSASAQVSYRKLDDTVEKADKVMAMLNLNDDDTDPAHASPTEHQATPIVHGVEGINVPNDFASWEPGITHVRRSGSLWSGNLCGWIQHRQLITREAVWETWA